MNENACPRPIIEMFGLPTNPLIVVAVLLGVAALAIALGYWLILRDIDSDRQSLTTAAQAVPGSITEAHLAQLPRCAQRYLQYAGVVGKPVPRIVTLSQKGRIRSKPDAGWMPLEADEIYSTNPPAFVWQAFLPSRAFPLATGRDEYLEGRCSIRIMLLGLVPVADQGGVALRKAGLIRYLNEMMWFPAALLGPNVRLIEIDENSFAAILSDRGESARGQFFVDEQGRLTNFRAQRYNTSTLTIETWETPVGSYREFEGHNLPASGTARWKIGEGDFTYIELEINDVSYRY
jgi:hypothetical protein